MPLFRVEVTKVLVANVYIDAEDEEEAEMILRDEQPDHDAFEVEDYSMTACEEVKADEARLEVFLHNDDRGRTVKDWLYDVEGDYE